MTIARGGRRRPERGGVLVTLNAPKPTLAITASHVECPVAVCRV